MLNHNNIFDVAKGLLILLVVFGHQPLGDELHRFIYSFHMGFFFILYGVLFKEHSNDLIQYIAFKSGNLIGTYYKAVVWSLLFFLLVSYIKFDVFSYEALTMKAIDYLVGSAYDGNLSPNGPLWFLLSYFFYNFYFQVVYYLEKKIGLAAHFVFIPIFISILFSFTLIPFTLNATILAIPFFYVGRFYKGWLLCLDSKYILILISLSLFLFFSIFMMGNYYDISVSNVGYYIDYILLGGLFFIPIIYFSIFLESTFFGPALVYLGKRTLGVLCYHILFITGSSYVLSRVLNLNYDVLRGSISYIVFISIASTFFLSYLFDIKKLKKWFI
ncbi:O-acetyltransferase [Pseudoalteromonas sp. PS1M3]|uniref:acyltransferase family protein n=1 Tax=Pseudoalteromonas sp. PS1M3 TaxID=87791 RepID=UPI001951DE7A|nr:acyltransferase family protein [Pseudoalteromonas sp. PS1M3]BBW90333.1 O-acetyltransferase [Pseudoalteromonas sp. PS1M3]